MRSNTSDGAWYIQGWTDIAKYRKWVTDIGAQTRYEDDGRLIIRIPPGIGQSEQFQVIECQVDPAVTNLWWLSVAIRKSALRAVLAEQFGREVASTIMDGTPPSKDLEG